MRQKIKELKIKKRFLTEFCCTVLILGLLSDVFGKETISHATEMKASATGVDALSIQDCDIHTIPLQYYGSDTVYG